MKGIKTIINVVLGIAVLGLAFWLYKVIQDPIQFQQAYKIRLEATKERLIDIRQAQKTYMQINGKYADNFDKLIGMIKNDSILTVKTVGDPNDTSVVVTYDTILEPVITSAAFRRSGFYPDSLQYVPYGKGGKFSIATGNIEKQRVNIPVFEVIAVREYYLKGLSKKYFKEHKDLKVGSLVEGTDSGNWE